MTNPRISVLINSYNYAEYVGEAIRSTLKQTLAPDEIIIVDDGSTDDSLDRIRQEFENESRIQIIAKSNGGQLSSFHAGQARATGDIVFFLDSDDSYTDEYIERAISFYAETPECDFLHCGMELFGNESGIEMYCEADYDHGFTVLEAIWTKHFRGSPTSAISMRRTVLDQILPLPLEPEYRSRADDCLVWGAGIVGAHKFFLAQPLIRYRVHDRNAHRGIAFTPHEITTRNYINTRMIGAVLARCNYHVPRLLNDILDEFESSPDGRTTADLARYRGIVRRSERNVLWCKKMSRKLSRSYTKMAKAQRRTRRMSVATSPGSDS